MFKKIVKSEHFNTRIKPTWCPGCGNYGIFDALKKALAFLKIPAYRVVVVTDVGCSGNMADYIKTYVFHSLHGRALPVAAGIKLANQQLSVIAIIGDGGCYGEGLTHFVNLMRGNHNIVCLVHNNHRYSLTTGQYSPTTPKGTITKSTPEGSIEEAINPLGLALINHATFVSRGFAGETKHLTEIIVKAIKHKGFSFVDILQPCVIFNKEQSYQWYRQRIYKLKGTLTKEKALKIAMDENKLALGVFYEEKKLAYHEEIATLKKQPLIKYSIAKVDIGRLISQFF